MLSLKTELLKLTGGREVPVVRIIRTRVFQTRNGDTESRTVTTTLYEDDWLDLVRMVSETDLEFQKIRREVS